MLYTQDLLWLFAYPIYQTLGTLRHEASHALVALLEGARIRAFVIWPTLSQQGRITWGYVSWAGNTSWLTTAAPYACDLLTYALCFWLCMTRPFSRRWVWLNLVILGLVSPLINSLYNYMGGFFKSNDVGRLLQTLPPVTVHLYFLVSISIYIIGLIAVLKHPRPTAFHRPSQV